MNIVNTENLAVGYGKKTVIDDINIEALRGQVLCLLGPNGAGKTTILRTLSGLLTPISGQVYIKDQKVAEINKKELAKILAIVLTKKLQGDFMTVFDIVATGRYPHTGYFGKLMPKDLDKIDEALKTVNAVDLTKRYFDELSDGEKQKVMVARALVQEPQVIILDEPTTHLDIKHRLELIDILKTLSNKKGITVILSLHEIDLALKSSDKVLLVKDGKIRAYGVPEDVVNEDIIRELYDMDEGAFNNLLGAVEIRNTNPSSVYVIGGDGSGIPVYRTLTKHHIGFSTGIVYDNDVDYEIARTIGVDIDSEEAFEEINDISYKKAINNLKDKDVVIDCGFHIGLINKKNLDLITYAVKNNIKVISLRGKEEAQKVYGDMLNKVCICSSMEEMLQEVELKLQDGDYKARHNNSKDRLELVKN